MVIDTSSIAIEREMDGWKCTSHFQGQSYAFPICILESYLPFHHIETIALSPFMAGQPDQTPLPADPSMPWLNSCCSCRNLSLWQQGLGDTKQPGLEPQAVSQAALQEGGEE